MKKCNREQIWEVEGGVQGKELVELKIKDWSWEVGSGAQWKNLWKIRIGD